MSGNEDPPEWLGATAQWEGYPLALRIRPDIDTAERQTSFAYLAALTHKLAHVQSSGLPEPEYNDSLAELDTFIITAFDCEGGGTAVLIETFGAKRTYYAYVMSKEHAARALADTRAMFRDAELSLEVRQDATWSFYAGYRRRFPW